MSCDPQLITTWKDECIVTHVIRIFRQRRDRVSKMTCQFGAHRQPLPGTNPSMPPILHSQRLKRPCQPRQPRPLSSWKATMWRRLLSLRAPRRRQPPHPSLSRTPRPPDRATANRRFKASPSIAGLIFISIATADAMIQPAALPAPALLRRLRRLPLSRR